MFILDRHGYHNVFALLVSDNTSCFEWRPEHTFKVIRKVQAAKNTICEITARNLPDGTTMKNSNPSLETSELKEDLNASEYGNH